MLSCPAVISYKIEHFQRKSHANTLLIVDLQEDTLMVFATKCFNDFLCDTTQR